MVTAILPTFSSTAFAAGTVTRSEWISRLVEAFSMTVESDDNMPDNYFSDISEDDSCYQDILLAVEFGVIDLEAGEAFEPDADATREFAAQTLNSCLMFQLDEDVEYTYSEADSVTYPDDIQVAVNRGWFALSGKNFLPEQAVTASEADAMIADAKEIIAGDVIDENHENTYEFAEGVIEIPETANAVIDADNTVIITDYDAQISEGDIFVVYASGLPVVLKAVTVETVDNVTTVTSTTDGTEDAITSAAAEGVAAVDLEAFQADEVSTYSVIDTSDSNAEYEELSIELQSIEYDKKANRLIMSKSVKLGSAAVGSINVTINDFKAPYKVDVLLGEYSIDILGNAVVTTNIKVDFGEYAGIPSSIPLGTIPVAGVGDISLEMQYSLKGDVTATWSGYLDTGASYSRFNGGFRNHLSFDKKDFSICAKAELSAGLKLSASINLLNIVKGSAWITSGARMSFSATGYNSGTPKLCVTTQGYLYASAGVSITIDYFLDAKTFSKPIDIYTASNSPIRVVYHYEDDQQVSSCTRGQSLKYTTSYNSHYFNPYSGQSSYGGGGGAGGTAEPVVIWEYKVENDGNATITKYSGNASAVVIPEKIDGYTVTKIGNRAFADNKIVRSVTMSNNIIAIDSSAFGGCINLSNVQLSKNITELGTYIFNGCTSLLEIEIPKSLTTVHFDYNNNGALQGSSIKTVTFEEGTTQVVPLLCKGATELENVTLLDSMTNIGGSAFNGCTSLKRIDIPNSITTIGDRAFLGCTQLDNLILPEYLTSIEAYAFEGCSSLSEIKIPNSVTKIENSTFKNCAKLSNVQLPEHITKIASSAFEECAALNTINIPNSVTNIEASAFKNCDELTEIKINMSGTIGTQAFYDCDALTTLELGDGVTEIGSELCRGCDKLSTVKLGKYITTIPDSAFRLCQSLETVTLPRFCITVAANAFAEDTKLTSFYAPVSVSKIETTSFSYPMKMTMYGKSGSYAEEYAGSRNMAFNAVNAPITSIKYADSSMSIARNATVRPQLDIEPDFDTSVVTFSTSDNKILTVSDTGLVKGVNYGTATITATADSGKSTSIEITVLKTATKLELDKTSLSLEQGQSDTLSVTMTPSDAADKLNWSSSNSEVATVDENGKITAVGVGTAVITVTAEYSSVSASCTVEVVGDVTITASAGEHGKITPSGEVSVKSNAKTTFAIIPDYGYVVKDVQVNGSSVGAVESYTFSNPKDNATIHADFAAVNVSYENGDVVITSEAKLDNLKLIIAEYNDDNSLVDCKIETVTAEPNVEHHVSVSPTGKYKLMLWSSMDTMRPVWASGN